MKCLSGRQPWWWAILHAGKRIENRRWNTHYRGPILLHAAKGCTPREYREGLDWMFNSIGNNFAYHIPRLEEMQRGGIVGRARVVDVIPVGGLPATFAPPGIDMRWHMPEQFGFVLEDVEPLPFLPCNGALGLWEFDERRLAADPSLMGSP